MSDGRLVYIKRVRSKSREFEIASMLSSPALANNPRNHSVPVLDSFPDDVDPDISYMVMPFLHPMDEPHLQHVEELIDFVDQILEVRIDF